MLGLCSRVSFRSSVCAMSWCKLSTADMLRQMEANSKQADSIIQSLKNQISELKGATAVTAPSSNLQALRTENEKLKTELEEWKTKLILAEIHSGIHQIPAPVIKKAIPDVENTPVTEEKIEPTKPAENKNKKAENSKKDKPKKAEADGGGAVMDVSRLDFRIGKIVSVKKHPDADTLYIEEVDVGEAAARTVVSGLVRHVTLQEMDGRLAVFLCNMKPAKMRGVASQAMIMCASTPDKVEILLPPAGVVPGDNVVFDGYDRNPDAQLNPKKKVFETLAPDLRVDGNKVATYKGVPFTVPGKGIVVAPSLVNVNIK